MKKTLVITVLAALLGTPVTSYAVSYYQNKNGSIKKISQAAFLACSGDVIYRRAGQEQLPPEVKRKALAAQLRGDAINDLDAAKSTLKSKTDACTYGADSEDFSN